MATYPVFLSHSWVEQDGVERITSLMETYRLKTEGFGYEYYSVSKDDPAQFLPSNKALALSIEKQMKPCSCLIILAGLLPQWIFYTAALLFYANSKKRQSRIVGWNSWQDRTRQLAEAGLVTGCVLLGTFVESFVNPAVFAWVLKIFC